MPRHHMILPRNPHLRLHVIHEVDGLGLYQGGNIVDVPADAVVELMNECSIWLQANRKEVTP